MNKNNQTHGHYLSPQVKVVETKPSSVLCTSLDTNNAPDYNRNVW